MQPTIFFIKDEQTGVHSVELSGTLPLELFLELLHDQIDKDDFPNWIIKSTPSDLSNPN